MDHIVSVMLFVVAVIHLLPAIGLIGSSQLFMLYGVDCEEANLQILMRHRAVLFGLVGMFMFSAIFFASLRGPALMAGSVSVVSFLVLAKFVGKYNSHIGRVVVTDFVALACLIVALLCIMR